MKKTVHILTLVCALFLMSCSAAFSREFSCASVENVLE